MVAVVLFQRHALNVSHGRHYSSDSELDAHVLVTGENPGSRKSMSRALNLHPIEMDMPIASGNQKQLICGYSVGPFYLFGSTKHT